MKKINLVCFVSLASLALTGSLFAQPSLPVYEGFDYVVANLCGNAGWAPTGSNASNDVQVIADSLIFPELPASQGNKVSVLNGSGYIDPGFDIVPVGNQTEASSVYGSFILNVVAEGNATGDYFFHFCSAGTTSTDYHSKVFVKQGSEAGKYLLGIRNASADTIQWETSNRDINTPVFVVVSYDFVVDAANDVSRLWINPTLGESAPGTPNLTTVASGTDLANGVGRVNLRQGSASTTMSVEVDEIRVGATWESVTPKASGVGDWNLY